MDNSMKWSFFQLWNESLEKGEQRPVTPRQRIWASEMGGSMVDRYLKMTGVEYTNPPNMRSLRKFEAGNIWEWIIGIVLKRADILLESQGWVKYEYDGLFPVTGKSDYIAGGKPDWEKARREIQTSEFPDFIKRSAEHIIDNLSKEFPEELKKIILEIKSSSSFMFDMVERNGQAQPQHRLQAFHYLKALGMDEAHVVYVCKDDCRMFETGIFNPSDVEEDYKADIETITGFVKAGEQPPIENEIDFNEETGKFSKNWRVEYSPYLTKLYGYKTPEEYRKRWDGEVASFNRTLTRITTGKNMTDLNKEVIGKMKAFFPNYEEIIAKAQDIQDKSDEKKEGEEK